MRTSEDLLGVPRESRGIKVKQKEYTLHWFPRSGQWRVFFLRIGLRPLSTSSASSLSLRRGT